MLSPRNQQSNTSLIVCYSSSDSERDNVGDEEGYYIGLNDVEEGDFGGINTKHMSMTVWMIN